VIKGQKGDFAGRFLVVAVPFTATAEAGGPGARLVLTISGLVFDEIVLEGAIKF
jgi:hypothetical protein